MLEPGTTAPAASPPIMISLSSFGAAEVRRHGQLWFTRLAHRAGADGVEVRGELLSAPDAELPAIADAARELGLQLVYSSPVGLWRDDGALDGTALDDALLRARSLGAPRLKMSIGGYRPGSAATLPTLARRLQGEAIEVVIENDQTVLAGTLPPLQRFFADCADAGLELGMTFDMGNWHWVGECPLQAARSLSARVCYVHCKGAQRQTRQWVAVPLVESAAPWRSLLRLLPCDQPWAIEFPLVGDDLLAVTRHHIDSLRALATGSAALPLAA